MTRVALVYPPGGDPRAPRLPLPSLSAALRSAGIHVSLFDLDIEGVLALLRPDNLLRAGREVGERASRDGSDRRLSLQRTAFRAPRLADGIDDAIATIRAPERFLDPVQLNAARERIYDALDLVSLAARRPLRYQTEVLSYEVEGVDTSRLSDLLSVTADRDANLFEDHWDEAFFPTLDHDGPFDLIGISITLRWQLVPGLSLARRLRERGHRVVLGGTAIAKISHRLPHLPDFFDAFADAVVTREGEAALIDLLDQWQGSGDLDRVPNLLFRRGEQVVSTRTHIKNYSAMPTPDFDGMPLDKYLSPHLVLPVMVGKGCYHDECTFCDIPFINRVSPKRYRVRTADTLADDIESLSARHGCRHFLLADEALPPKVLERLADALDARGVRDVAFSGYARLEPAFTPDLCAKLARMGLRRLYFGLESADQATLDRMKKGIRVENVRPVLRNCVESGIRFHVFSMIGFPGETETQARKTIDFFKDNADLFDDPGDSFDVHQLEILTDTEYFARPEAFGIKVNVPIDGRDFLYGIGAGWENTDGLTRPEIASLLQEAAEFATSSTRFARYHAWPPILWPAQEEWSLCYAAAYFKAPFPHRVGLQPQSDDALYRFSWSASADIEQTGTQHTVTSRRGRVEIDPVSFRLLGEDPRFRSPDEIFTSLSGAPAGAPGNDDVQNYVTSLVRARLLDIVHRAPQARTAEAERA